MASDARHFLLLARTCHCTTSRVAGDVRRCDAHVSLYIVGVGEGYLYSDVIMSAIASRLFAQPFVQAQIKENTKAPRHLPLWGESIVEQWIPITVPVTWKMFLFDDVFMGSDYPTFTPIYPCPHRQQLTTESCPNDNHISGTVVCCHSEAPVHQDWLEGLHCWYQDTRDTDTQITPSSFQLN